MKMWSGRFRQPLDPHFEEWQRSFPFDQKLLRYELAASRAHAQALKAAGNPPTRAGLMKALTSLNTRANPFLYRGIAEKTSPTDWFPVEQQILTRYHSGGPAGIGYGQPFGRLYNNAR